MRIVLLTVSIQVLETLEWALRTSGHKLAAVLLPAGLGMPQPWGEIDWTSMMGMLRKVPPTTDVLMTSQRSRLAPLIASAQPDLLLSFFFPWRIPNEALTVPPLGAVNVHPALLPRHRGPNPLGWTLHSGDPELGLTFHRMDAQFDTGPLLAQGSQRIEDYDDALSLQRKLMFLAVELMPQVLERVARGDAGEPQPQEGASYAGYFEDSYREVDWSWPAREVHKRVLTCSVSSWRSHPMGALAWLEGQRVLLMSTALPYGTGPVRAPPGTVLEREGHTLTVQCGDGPLQVLHLPWEGSSRMPG
jgi:methionyl-tRNA formyltransferase